MLLQLKKKTNKIIVIEERLSFKSDIFFVISGLSKTMNKYGTVVLMKSMLDNLGSVCSRDQNLR